MCRKDNYYRANELIGVLLSENQLAQASRHYTREFESGRLNSILGICTTDPRLLTALKLIGYTTLYKGPIVGIETFMKLKG